MSTNYFGSSSSTQADSDYSSLSDDDDDFRGNNRDEESYSSDSSDSDDESQSLSSTSSASSSSSSSSSAASMLRPLPPQTAALDRSAHPSGIIPPLQNVVATTNLNTPLDLKKIALHAKNAEYNPKRFAAVIIRIRDPKTTALIFASGKMVVTGAKSEEAARLASRRFARIIQKLEFPVKFKDFKIQNIVASASVNFPIRLETLCLSHANFCSYEPELFPGLVYRMINPRVVVLIFVSGKIILTGAKTRQDIYQAFENLYPVLQEFRK